MRRKYPELNNSGPTLFPRESRLFMRNKLEIFATGVASTGFCPDQVGGGKKGVGGWKKGGGGGGSWSSVGE